MKLHNLKKVSDYEVQNWLEKSIPELTAYQKQKIRDTEIVRFSHLEFFKRRERVKSIWWRLSLIIFPIFWVIIFISLPINFLFTGSWGYSHKRIGWVETWMHKMGI